MPRILGSGREVTDDEQKLITETSMESRKLSTVLAACNLAHWLQQGERPVLFQATEPCKGFWRYWNGRYWELYHEIIFRADIDWLFDGELTNTKLNELLNTIKNKLSVPYEKFDQLPLVVFRGEVWQVKENKLSKYKPGFRPEDLMTVGLPFTPRAIPTPKWNEFLDLIMPDPTDRKTLQELLGYVHFPTLSKQVFFLFLGEDGTGKDTVMTILRTMLGEARTSSLPINQLSRAHATSALAETIVNFDGEAEGIEKTGELVLKQISGDSPILIDPKFMKPFSKTVPTKFIMSCNTLPHFYDRSNALWARYVAVPFKHRIPQGNHKKAEDFCKELEEEFDGIIAWGIKGLDRVLKTGKYRSAAFTQSEQAESQKASHKRDSNPFLCWFEECVERVEDRLTVSRSVVYDDYVDWMARNGHRAVLASTNFGKEMKRMGVQVRRQKRPPEHYAGIRLVDSEADPAIYKMTTA